MKIFLADECRSGSVLILAMWSLLFLTAIAFACGILARQEVVLVGKTEDRSEFYHAAYSGVTLALSEVCSYYKNAQAGMPDALNSKLFNDIGVFKDNTVGSMKTSVSYEYLNSMKNKKELYYGVSDEERRININFAGTGTLARLLVDVAKMDEKNAEKLALFIKDWRDSDNMLGDETYAGTERADYINSGLSYSPPNRPFLTIEEVLLVKGMDLDIFGAIRGYVTVYGSGKININTAPGPVLFSLGLTSQTIDKIVSYRCGEDLLEGTPDDRIFMSVDDIINNINKVYKLDQNDKEKLTELIFGNILNIESTVFRAIGRSGGSVGGTQANVICLFRKDGTILYWGSVFLS